MSFILRKKSLNEFCLEIRTEFLTNLKLCEETFSALIIKKVKMSINSRKQNIQDALCRLNPILWYEIFIQGLILYVKIKTFISFIYKLILALNEWYHFIHT